MHPDRAVKHMPTVDVYRLRLAGLQGVWDTLSLLSHMGGDGTDLTKTRQAFESLAGELVNHLCDETFRKSSRELHAKAQVAIDVMVRNLFERTADIGFLCADDDIRGYLERAASDPESSANDRLIRQRLREYVEKYSVYDNVILVAPNGRVLLQHKDGPHIERTADALIDATLRTPAGYVETYRRCDLTGNARPSLIYSYRVMSGHKAVGVLCLCFDFDSEIERIFSKLHSAEDWTVLAWLDAHGTVIASSDPLQVPEGALMPLALEDRGRVVRFAGREYLAITRPTAGYQGYLGPGWYGHAMLPLEHAFEQTGDEQQSTDQTILASLACSTHIFTEALRKVPEQADAIQRELNRSVWNGNVRLASRTTENNTFAKALLREVSATGEKTNQVFSRSIGDLHETVLSSILQESRFVATLAVELMDRNLYERANDCRWWALNGTLRDCLAGEVAAEKAGAVLENINRLYTVYDTLVLFDKDTKAIAVSNARTKHLVGKTLQYSWAKAALALHSSQAYGVSLFEQSDIYGGRHTYVFTAAIRSKQGRVLGGIGIVFDSEPQFRAMLEDVLPRTNAGAPSTACVAALVDANGRVISATSRYSPGEELKLPAALLASHAESLAQLLAIDGYYYAVGARRASGYREFTGVNATAVVMMPIGAVSTATVQGMQRRPASIPSKGRRMIDLATFCCAGQWFAVPAAEVVEAIDNANVTRMPGRGPGCTGVIKYRNQVVPLLSLNQLMRPGDETACDSIIVVAAPNQPMIGLQVETLGDVVEAPAECVMPVAELLSGIDHRLGARMVRPDATDLPLFLLLDPAALTALMRPPEAQRMRA